jgi:hypothetical protein
MRSALYYTNIVELALNNNHSLLFLPKGNDVGIGLITKTRLATYEMIQKLQILLSGLWLCQKLNKKQHILTKTKCDSIFVTGL